MQSFVLLLLAALPCEAAGSAFLGKAVSAAGPQVDILELLGRELGEGHGRTEEARIQELQQELEHTFASLPKNSNGTLQAAGARYALHRLFVQRHAWQLSGLEPSGQGWSTIMASDALGDRVPTSVRSFFATKLGEHGVSLHELAVLAALLESMTHAEIGDRLHITFQAFGLNETEKVDANTARKLLQTYMASYVLGVPLAKLTASSVQRHLAAVRRAYPTWSDTTAFVEEIRKAVSKGAEELDFALLSEILAGVADQYGRWQNKECGALKSTLVKMESRPGSGRVRLGDFYNSALSGENWQFSESLDYLRQTGALDETEGKEPSVIIPNYIASPSNCVASSGFYSVCCVDECESLMDRLEAKIRAPTARVGEILYAFPERSFSPALVARLEEVADMHEGEVPLHGRLFAQWMHLAHPRECPFPYVTGTTKPQEVEDYIAVTGSQASASKEEMKQFAESSGAMPEEENEDGLCSTMWTLEEELVDPAAHKAHVEASRPVFRSRSAALRGLAHAFAFAAAIVAAAFTLAKLVSVPAAGADGKAPKSFRAKCEAYHV